MEMLVKFRKGFTAGRRKYKKGDYAYLMVSCTIKKRSQAEVWFDECTESDTVKLDELLDAVEVIK